VCADIDFVRHKSGVRSHEVLHDRLPAADRALVELDVPAAPVQWIREILADELIAARPATLVVDVVLDRVAELRVKVDTLPREARMFLAYVLARSVRKHRAVNGRQCECALVFRITVVATPSPHGSHRFIPWFAVGAFDGRAKRTSIDAFGPIVCFA
jgi:hypothetical protein